MSKNHSHQIYDDPRIVWLPPAMLVLAFTAAQLGEPGAFQAAFLLAGALGTLVVYGRHAGKIHGFANERNPWRRNNLAWTHLLAAALGWGLLYFFFAYRLVGICSEPMTAVLGKLMASFRASDLLLLLTAFLGVTGQLPAVFSLGKRE